MVGQRLRRVGPVVIAVLMLAACGGGEGGGHGGGDRAERAPTTMGERAATSTSSRPDGSGRGGGQLDGTSWVIDANESLAANLSNLGGLPPGLSCRGPLTLSFADGRFTWSGEFTCSMADTPIEGRGSFRTEGAYDASGSELTLRDAEGSGTISIAGQEIPFGDDLPYRAGTTYRVSGDTLEITFTDPSVGTVTHRYGRAG
jgi:hypothetical protein